MVKNLPVILETWVRSLGEEDILEKAMATHSNILAWRIPWTKEPGRLQSMGSQKVGHDSSTNTFTFHHPVSLRPTLFDLKFRLSCDFGVVEASDRGIFINCPGMVHPCPGMVKTEFLNLLLTPNLHSPQSLSSVLGTAHKVLQCPSLPP